MNEANLVDAVIYGPADERIGTVAHVHGMRSATQVIVDVGTFLGIGSKPVALETNQFNLMRDEDGMVHAVIPWTKYQVKDYPSIATETIYDSPA